MQDKKVVSSIEMKQLGTYQILLCQYVAIAQLQCHLNWAVTRPGVQVRQVRH